MDKLGIEPSLLLAQIINFAVILFVMQRLLYKPILKMLDKRRREIEAGLKLTQKLTDDEAKMQQKKEKILDEAKGEGRVIIAEAQKDAKNEAKEILAEAHKQASEIIEKGKLETISLRKEMEKEVQKATVDLATAMSRRLLSTAMSDESAHVLIKKHLRELSTMKA